MIRNNFSILLAERQLKITRVSIDTGISRSTLTSISQNDTKMIQTEIIDKLCFYLNIEPKDFFVYIPLTYSIEILRNEENIDGDVRQSGCDDDEYDYLLDIFEVYIKNINYDIFLKFIDKSQVSPLEYTEELNLYIDYFKLDDLPFSQNVLQTQLTFSTKKNQGEFLEQIWSKLDPTMKKLFIDQLTDEIKITIKKDFHDLISIKGLLLNKNENSLKKAIEAHLKTIKLIYNNPIFDID